MQIIHVSIINIYQKTYHIEVINCKYISEDHLFEMRKFHIYISENLHYIQVTNCKDIFEDHLFEMRWFSRGHCELNYDIFNSNIWEIPWLMSKPCQCHFCKHPACHFNIELSFHQYRNSNHKYNMVIIGIPLPGKWKDGLCIEIMPRDSNYWN